jgi:hypothetical protein
VPVRKERRRVGVARRALHSGWMTEAEGDVGMQANRGLVNGKTENDTIHTNTAEWAGLPYDEEEEGSTSGPQSLPIRHQYFQP